MASANALRCSLIYRKMNVFTMARLEAFVLDCFKEPTCCAMEQDAGRLDRREAEIDRYRMPLIRSNSLAIFSECEPLLLSH
jgi:hypothetical protein